MNGVTIGPLERFGVGHKRTVVVCVLEGALGRAEVSQTKSFGTTTPELMEMIEWLKGCKATDLAMEATGNYWMPIYNLLEGHFELIVANAAHMKAVPGRKIDVQEFRTPSGSLTSYAMVFCVPASFRRGNRETCGS